MVVTSAAWAEGTATATAAVLTSTRAARTPPGVVSSSTTRPRSGPELGEPPELARLREAERELLARAEDEQSRRAEQLRARQAELLVRREDLRDELRRRAAARPLPPEEADRAYESTRQRLRVARTALAAALDARAAPLATAAQLDVLTAWPDDPLYAELQARRTQLESAEAELRADEAAVLDASAALLLEELDALNTERLALLPQLTPSRREELTGWGEPARDQARAELRHLALVLRGHHDVARAWLRALDRRAPTAVSPSQLLWAGVPWLGLLVLFLAARRHSGTILAAVERRWASQDTLQRRDTPSPARRTLQLLRGSHRTLEWMLLAWAASALLPDSARRLVEVQLLGTVATWTLGASLLVSVVNTLTAQAHASRSADHDEVGALRLRSLRLVGRVAVALGLAQVIVARLVGEGTIHAWVTRLWPWAALVVLLLLVRAWRSVVFDRVSRARRRSDFDAWVLDHRTGGASLIAATLGGLYLFVRGVARAVRRYLASFELGRRAHAYLFRRELARLADVDVTRVRTPLGEDTRAALDPERPASPWVASPADVTIASISARVSRGLGGLVAVVGPRGAGKTSLLARLETEHPGALRWTSPHVSPPGAADTALVLVDDVHLLIKPAVGGLAGFDALVAAARGPGARALWVLALDDTLWPFLARARDVRPTFDEVLHLAPWSEEALDALLVTRSEAAGLELTFEDLLEQLPAGADELERQDALAARRAGYVRMLWDHVGGNPGLALEAWRASLACGPAGRVHVRPLQVPDPTELEGLPDSTLFVLRAVLQLGPTAEADVAEVTRLGLGDVHGAVCFGEARGYVVVHGGRVHVTWRWLSALVRHLQRRHLLVSS
jgi:hypothetical protein